MYRETIDHFAELGVTKARNFQQAPRSSLVGAAMAGAYVGMGLLLALSVASPLPAMVRPLVMGAVFGLALLLVIFAGGELFTGYVMYLSFALFARGISWREALRTGSLVWLGNLAGAALLSALFTAGGGGTLFSGDSPLAVGYALHKTELTSLEMVARGMLCNWLVCLAIWCSARLNGDAAKIAVLAWCLCAFVACGYEHSVANMTAFSLAAMMPGSSALNGWDVVRNLGFVTLGNMLSGGLLVAGGYAAAALPERDDRHAHDCGALPAELKPRKTATWQPTQVEPE